MISWQVAFSIHSVLMLVMPAILRRQPPVQAVDPYDLHSMQVERGSITRDEVVPLRQRQRLVSCSFRAVRILISSPIVLLRSKML